jgi:hypothetical protein
LVRRNRRRGISALQELADPWSKDRRDAEEEDIEDYIVGAREIFEFKLAWLAERR